MSEKIYPQGLRTFPKRENAPDFVLGTLVITPDDLVKWLEENENYLKDYEGKKQLVLNMTKGINGVLLTVNTYKK